MEGLLSSRRPVENFLPKEGLQRTSVCRLPIKVLPPVEGCDILFQILLSIRVFKVQEISSGSSLSKIFLKNFLPTGEQ